MIEAIKEAGLNLKFDVSQIEGGIQTNPLVDLHSDVALIDHVGGLQDRSIAQTDTVHPSVWARYDARKDYRPKTLEPVVPNRPKI
jgi:hypothetical protein